MKRSKKPRRLPPEAGSKNTQPPQPISASRRAFFRFASLILVPAVFLSTVELALRLAGVGFPTNFFSKVRVGPIDYFVNNESFSRRFFPPGLERWPSAVMFEAHKPRNNFRIFVLGESAARGEPEPAEAASRYLLALLEARFPEAKFEIINLGITAINSHVILPIARECARHEGDLWIVYMGNNEMVGPFGGATVFGLKAPPLWLVRMNLELQRTRIGQVLTRLTRKLGSGATPASWSGMQMFLGNQIAATDPRREVVYRNFRQNLADILNAGRDSGAKIVLSTVAVNLKDCPPFASVPGTNLAPADLAQFNEAIAEARASASSNNTANALARLEQAARLDPFNADLEFLRAECLLAQTNAPAARARFQNACDYDALPFRATSRINELVREAGRRLPADNRALLCDAELEMQTNAPSGIAGRELFYEHVHFNFDGQYRLARSWAFRVEQLLPSNLKTRAAPQWLDQRACERRLAVSDWNRAAVLNAVIWRLHRPPMSAQPNNPRRIAILEDEFRAIRSRMNRATEVECRAFFAQAVSHSPGDHWLKQNLAEFLESVGDTAGALAQWQKVQELLPSDFVSRYQAGRLMVELGQFVAAEAVLGQALALRRQSPESWFELGKAQLGQEKLPMALRSFQTAYQMEPSDAGCIKFIGRTLSKMGRREEAIQHYRKSLALNGDAWEVHFALGEELAAAQQFSDAETEYREVTRLQPTNLVASLNLGVMLARQGRLDPAVQQFEAVLRLDPGNRQAQEYLDRVRSWRQSPRK